jgi:nucleotide-binding universal stress UspA family protein
MTIKSILVALDIDTPSKPLIASAVGLAERFGAELLGVSAAQPSLGLVAVEGGLITDEIYLEERRNIEQRLEEVEELFRAAVPPAVRSKWRAHLETPSRTIIEAARRADLVMLSSSAVSIEDNMRRSDPADIVLSSGRPLLVTAAGVSSVAARKVLVGWKDEREARRAVSDALPFLAAADEVFVVSVEEGDLGRAQVGLDDVSDWLKLHGVKVAAEIRARTDKPARVLHSIYQENGCDLIVAGAYGHHRIRERLFGGVTEDLITDTGMSRLLSS